MIVFSVESEPSSDDPFDKALNDIGSAIERNIDRASRSAVHLDRTLISLSAGALILSISFVPIFAPQKLWLPLLFFAWLSFVSSMILVILAMRSEQYAIEKEIHNAATSLKQLEEHPTFARKIIAQLGLPAPVSTKQVSKNLVVMRLNRCALIAFIIGVVSLATFTGYNLWRTPPPVSSAKSVNP